MRVGLKLAIWIGSTLCVCSILLFLVNDALFAKLRQRSADEIERIIDDQQQSSLNQLEESLHNRVKLIGSFIASIALDPIVTSDYITLEGYIEEALTDPEILFGEIRNGSDEPMTAFDRPATRPDGVVVVETPIEYNGDHYGTVELWLDTGPTRSKGSAIRDVSRQRMHNNMEKSAHSFDTANHRINIALFSLALLQVGVLMFLIRRWISCPLREMTAVLQGFAMDNLSLRMPVTGQDEIAHLANGFNRMADKLDRQLTLVRSSNLTLNTIIEHNPFGILLIEEGDQLHHANQTALETLGYRSDEFSGTLFSSLVDGPSPFDGYDQPIETRFRQSNGRSIPVFCKAISIVIEAGPMRMVTFIDYRGQQQARLEMQRALEAIEGANRTKNQFLTTISHETLTPLNGIMGMAQVLEETELDDDQRIYLSALHQSAEQLLNIIKEVLDYTRLEANRSEGIATTFNPLHLVNTTVDLVRGLADARRLTIAIEHDPLLPDEVSGNPESIQKVLMQLLENALKYTNEGGIRVRVTMSSHDFDQVRLTWQVIDSGIGISLDRREELFQPFVQEDGSITRTFGGTGLGLALARQLVETMSGAIDFESEPGKGSTFWFTIPLAVDPLRHAPP